MREGDWFRVTSGSALAVLLHVPPIPRLALHAEPECARAILFVAVRDSVGHERGDLDGIVVVEEHAIVLGLQIADRLRPLPAVLALDAVEQGDQVAPRPLAPRKPRREPPLQAALFG
jgi:hypothetical protein